MPHKQEEQIASETNISNTEDCQRISDKCDIVIKKIKTRIKTKKRVKND